MALEIAHRLLCHRAEHAVEEVILRLVAVELELLLRVLRPGTAVELLEPGMIAGWFVVILTHVTIKRSVRA